MFASLKWSWKAYIHKTKHSYTDMLLQFYALKQVQRTNEFLVVFLFSFQVIIVTTSPSSTFVPNILSKSHNYAAVTKLVPTSVIASTTQKQPVVITASQSSLVSSSSSSSSCSTPSCTASTIAVTAVVSSTPSVVMSTVAQGMAVTLCVQKLSHCWVRLGEQRRDVLCVYMCRVKNRRREKSLRKLIQSTPQRVLLDTALSLFNNTWVGLNLKFLVF